MLVGPDRAARVVSELFDSGYAGFVRYAFWASRSLEPHEEAAAMQIAGRRSSSKGR